MNASMVAESRSRSLLPLLTETAAGLWCAAGGFHIDPWEPVDRAVITHAHGDHARPGSAAYSVREPCAAAAPPPLRRGRARSSRCPTASARTIGGVRRQSSIRQDTCSARRRSGSKAPDGVWVVAGDYKRAPDPTCAPFEPVRCDTFITESTFGLPIYRWDPTEVVIADIAAWWNSNRDSGRTSVLFCYTLGKAQRLLAELRRVTDRHRATCTA